MNLKIAPAPSEQLEPILNSDAIGFLADLHRRFGSTRAELLQQRRGRRVPEDSLADTAGIRADPDWRVVAPADDYRDRRVEITGPTDRKLVINALNSGANGFMADFEDANSPTWRNQVEGQLNLRDARVGDISYHSADGRHYALKGDTAKLLVRPRGWHLDEAHVQADGVPFSGALFDFGLFAFHNARAITDAGDCVHLYLPKLEHYLEARLWNDVFAFTERALGLPHAAFRATVLIETFPAAFQMEEMLYELRERSDGLNAGRWDYIFSLIKSFGARPDFVLPDRCDVKMTVPFMRAYTQLLVHTCHKRGTFAMGGMAALIPSRRDPEANERALAAVRADKAREVKDGFDGTWVAHPDVVAVARAEFDAVLGSRPNQIDRRTSLNVTAADLLNVAATGGQITEAGVRDNINVAFQYISFWLTGRGAAGINNLMEDTATAEISRSQLWQWLTHGVKLADGRPLTRELVIALVDEELATIRATVGEETWQAGRPAESRAILEHVALCDELPDFLTLSAYSVLEPTPAWD
jgi:malate synthase